MPPRDPHPVRLTHRVLDALAAVRRQVLRRRRPVALALVAVAALAGLRSVAPPEPPTATVLVAARDLPAGRLLTAGDLTPVRLPAGLAPDSLADAPVGRVLAAPLRPGEPVTDVRLVGEDLAVAQPDDVRAVPVRLADAAQAALLTPGDTLELLATDPRAGTSTVLAADVTVLAVPDAEVAADGALPGRLVVLALPAHEVPGVTSAAVAGYVTYTWSRG